MSIKEHYTTMISKPWVAGLWFNVIWIVAVAGQDSSVAVLMAVLTLHFLLLKNMQRDFFHVLLIAPVGVFVDASMGLFGVFIFASQSPVPAWLVLLWCAFAIAVSRVFYLFARYKLLAIAVGCVGGSLSYVTGNNLGAVEFGIPLLLTALLVALIWGLLFPLFTTLSERLGGLPQ